MTALRLDTVLEGPPVRMDSEDKQGMGSICTTSDPGLRQVADCCGNEKDTASSGGSGVVPHIPVLLPQARS